MAFTNFLFSPSYLLSVPLLIALCLYLKLLLRRSIDLRTPLMGTSLELSALCYWLLPNSGHTLSLEALLLCCDLPAHLVLIFSNILLCSIVIIINDERSSALALQVSCCSTSGQESIYRMVED